MGKMFIGGKPYEAARVFFYCGGVGNHPFDGKSLASLDANGDNFISFDEVKRDILKYTRLATLTPVSKYEGETVEEAKKARDAGIKRAEELARKREEKPYNSRIF